MVTPDHGVPPEPVLLPKTQENVDENRYMLKQGNMTFSRAHRPDIPPSPPQPFYTDEIRKTRE